MTDRIERELELTSAAEDVCASTGPDGLRAGLAEEVQLQLGPGGDARFVVEGEARSGWVEEVRPPRDGRGGRLVFWWQADEQAASRVSLELDATEAGTRLRVVEARPLEILDLVGMPMPGAGGFGGHTRGPALLAV